MLRKTCKNRSNAHVRKCFSKKSILREPFVVIFYRFNTSFITQILNHEFHEFDEWLSRCLFVQFV